MRAEPVILWTDALIFLLLVAVLAFIWYARRREHLRAPWRHVRSSRLAMASSVVLLFYVAFGLLDSLHFRTALPANNHGNGQTYYSAEVLSVLDVILAPLREHTEKTYSAPFATHLYATETLTRPDGSQTRTYPRLRYGGAHLADPASQRLGDIGMTALFAFWHAFILWALLVLAVTGLIARHDRQGYGRTWRAIWTGATPLPWHVVFLTAGVVLVVSALAGEWSLKYHVLGTDKVGQDVLYLVLKSIRTGLIFGTLTTLWMLPFAVVLGIMAGYFRGWVDDVVQYLYTTLSSIPDVLLIVAAILSLEIYIDNHPDMFNTIAQRADLRLLALCVILGVTNWVTLCRLLRGEVLKLCEADYVQAAVALGTRHIRILFRHLLPNVMHMVLITVVLNFSGLVLAEAVLSYIGVGVDPTMNSWGNMINAARLEMAREPVVWWSLAAAFLFMFTLVLAANLFSDVVRDAFDPRLRKQ